MIDQIQDLCLEITLLTIIMMMMMMMMMMIMVYFVYYQVAIIFDVSMGCVLSYSLFLCTTMNSALTTRYCYMYYNNVIYFNI